MIHSREDVVALCHGVSRAIEAAARNIPRGAALMPHHSEAPEEIKRWTREIVDQVDGDRTVSPQQIHETWMVRRRAERWSWSPGFSVEMRESPLFCEWGQTPPVYRMCLGAMIEVAVHLLPAPILIDPTPLRHLTL